MATSQFTQAGQRPVRDHSRIRGRALRRCLIAAALATTAGLTIALGVDFAPAPSRSSDRPATPSTGHDARPPAVVLDWPMLPWPSPRGTARASRAADGKASTERPASSVPTVPVESSTANTAAAPAPLPAQPGEDFSWQN